MSYGESLYSTLLFTANELEDIDDVNTVDLMKYLPAYYKGVQEIEELQQSLGIEIYGLTTRVQEVLDQAYVETATWSLARWEAELGLSSDPSKSYVNRREMVKAKRRGTGTTTPEMIQRTASAFAGGEVSVEEVSGEYRFIVRFIGILGIPPNMAGLIQILDEIKPAHLAYEFAYTYTYWDSLKAITWNNAHAGTWNDLRTFG
ncbi:putative phage tail protein [Paenibacillus sp. FSL P2-0121]|uniref:putative phage tail protein n=1 Tax=Paenibacillus sp. FSL P2-0121 TaxID=2921626 RepID=UPI0030CC9A9A